MSEEIARKSDPLRPHLGSLDADALLANALAESGPASDWPDGYEPLGRLGSGGMGEVYLARDVALEREVAIKLVHPEFTGEPMIRDRMMREARTMSSVQHPGIVSIHQLVPLGDDSLAIIMEYVGGGNLRDRIHSHGKNFPIPELLRIGRETAEAIQAAHSQGIVHRDLKPENILLTTDGRVKVADFGLAAPMDPLATRLTVAGTTAGTLDYMAPERHVEAETSTSADIYALGVILYEMLTGILPRGHFDAPHRLRPEVPKSVSEAVMRALKNDPTQRFPSMDAFAARLHPHRPAKHLLLVGAVVIALLGWQAAEWMHSTEPSKTGSTEPKTIGPMPDAEPSNRSSPTVSADGWRNLFPTLSPIRDRQSGGWRTTPEGLVSDNQICILRLSEDMPDSYELRLRFTRLEGVHSIAVFFRSRSGMGSIDIDGWGEGLCGLQAVNGQDLRSRHSFTHRLQNQRPCELRVLVSPDHIQVFLDGENRYSSTIDGDLSVVAPWNWHPDPAIDLAIGSYQSSTLFSTIEWRPYTP